MIEFGTDDAELTAAFDTLPDADQRSPFMSEVADRPAVKDVISAPINYALITGEKLVNETFGPNNIRRRTTGNYEKRTMQIRDGRACPAGTFSLDNTGFVLVDHPLVELVRHRLAPLAAWAERDDRLMADLGRQVIDFDRRSRNRHHEPLYHVLELADIARPRVLHQHLHGVGRHGRDRRGRAVRGALPRLPRARDRARGSRGIATTSGRSPSGTRSRPSPRRESSPGRRPW